MPDTRYTNSRCFYFIGYLTLGWVVDGLKSERYNFKSIFEVVKFRAAKVRHSAGSGNYLYHLVSSRACTDSTRIRQTSFKVNPRLTLAQSIRGSRVRTGNRGKGLEWKGEVRVHTSLGTARHGFSSEGRSRSVFGASAWRWLQSRVLIELRDLALNKLSLIRMFKELSSLERT